MTRTLVSIGCLLVAGIAGAKPYVSKTSGFSFDFPQAPKEEVEPLETADGTLQIHSFSAELPDGVVLVEQYDYANDGDLKPAARLDKIVDGEVTGMNGTVVTPKASCDHGKTLCRSIAYMGKTDSGNMLVKNLRTYLVGRRVYQTAVVTAATNGTKPERIRALLDSFSIAK